MWSCTRQGGGRKCSSGSRDGEKKNLLRQLSTHGMSRNAADRYAGKYQHWVAKSGRLYLAMRKALYEAGLTPADIKHVNLQATIDLSIKEDVWALFGTYGITRNWDVGIVVPIIHIDFRAVGDATIIRNSPVSTLVHNFGPDSSPSHVSGGGEETGVGDILVRTKYNFLRNQGAWPDLAVLGQAKLPSGDPDNLLGTGHTNFLGMLVASKTYGFLTPHVNAGYELTTGPREDDNLRYIVGFDARVTIYAANWLIAGILRFFIMSRMSLPERWRGM